MLTWVIFFFFIGIIIIVIEFRFVLIFFVWPFLSFNIICNIIFILLVLIIPISYNCFINILIILLIVSLHFSWCFRLFFNLWLTCIITLTFCPFHIFILFLKTSQFHIIRNVLFFFFLVIFMINFNLYIIIFMVIFIM